MPFINEVLENVSANITDVALSDGKNESVTVVLTVKIENGDTIKSYQYLNGTIRQSGRHQGRTNCEVNIEMLRDLGWVSAPDCSRIDELLNNPCTITTEFDDKDGKCRVKWLNAPYSRMDPAEANRRIVSMLGADAALGMAQPKKAINERFSFDPENIDEIPF